MVHGVFVWLYGQDGIGHSNAVVGKLGHVAVFTAIGTTARLATKSSIIFLAAAIAVFALATEVLQMCVNGRSPASADLVIDVVAAFFGLLLGAIFWLVIEP